MKIATTFCIVVLSVTAFAVSPSVETNAAQHGKNDSRQVLSGDKLQEILNALLKTREQEEEIFVKSNPYRRLKNSNLSPSTPIQSWTANSDTNDVYVTICTDSISWGDETVLAFREFRFSPDGRLLSISPVKEIRRNGRNPRINLK